jgi:hypothetical protein
MSRRFQFSLGNFYLCVLSFAGMLWAFGFDWPLPAVGIAWCITLAGSWIKEVRPTPRPRTILGAAIAAAIFVCLTRILTVFDSAFATGLLVIFAHRLIFG